VPAAPATRRCSLVPGLLYASAQVTPGICPPRAQPRSHALGARPQAEQAAYISIGGRHVDSPTAWAEYMALTGSPAEPLAVAHLLFFEPKAALGACAPAGVCPPSRAGTWADELALRALATAYGRAVIAVRPWALLCQGARVSIRRSGSRAASNG